MHGKGNNFLSCRRQACNDKPDEAAPVWEEVIVTLHCSSQRRARVLIYCGALCDLN